MSKISSTTVTVFTLAVFFLAYGFVYETSYFQTLGLSATATFGVRHFIYAGFFSTITPLLLLVVFGLIGKFFSKQIERDDAQAFIASAKEIGFKKSLFMARMVFGVSLFVWLLAIFEHHLYEVPRAWSTIPWLTLFTLQAFAFAIFTSPRQSLPSVAFAFMLAIGLCISTWAIGTARMVQFSLPKSAEVIRDDRIVRIYRASTGLKAEAKPLRLPSPMLEAFIDKFIGEAK